MKRVLVIVALVLGVLWWRHEPREPVDVANTERVLSDLAAHRGIVWETTRNQGSLEVRTYQHEPAHIEVAYGKARIATGDWRMIVELDKVTEIVCVRQFHHYPEPWVWLELSFRKGPDDEDGYPDVLFSVVFDESDEAGMRSICDRRGLRKVGDGW